MQQKTSAGVSDAVKRLVTALANTSLVSRKAKAVEAVTGAGAGGIAGLSHKNDRGDRSLLRMLAGAAAGSAGAVGVPELARRGMGRVMTNTVMPFSYDSAEHMALIRKTKLKDILKAIVEDVPIYSRKTSPDLREYSDIIPDIVKDGRYLDREVPYRMAFGLKPRAYADSFSQTGPRALEYVRSNPDNYHLLNNVKSNYLRGIAEKYDVTTAEALRMVQRGEITEKIPIRSMTAGAGMSVTPDMKFSDRWDFRFNNPDELFTSEDGSMRTRAARVLMNMFSDPVTLSGDISHTIKKAPKRKVRSA